MDETVDIWDAGGNPTGKQALKSEAHQNGWWHPTAHIWFYTQRGKVLLQRRSEEKATDPGLWDASVAGHIAAGETVLEGAVREIREEIGLEVPAGALWPAGIFKSFREHPGGVEDREFNHVYLCELKAPLESLEPQPGEVAELKLMPLMAFAEEVWGLGRPGRYVPHGPEYYSNLIRKIRSRR